MCRFTATTCALALALAAAGMIAASAGTAQASTCSHAYLPLPDSSCTPGAYNSDVTQSNIQSTICVSGWTAAVRPPTSYTNPLKAAEGPGHHRLRLLRHQHGRLRRGPPGCLRTRRLAPQHQQPVAEPYSGTKTATTKDGVETKLKNAVCAGTITLPAARSAIKTNWTTALQVTGIG